MQFQTLEYDKQLVNDPRIQWEEIASFEPHPISPYGDEEFGYQTICMSIEQIWGSAGVLVAPGKLFVAMTYEIN
jgi:hypothetical protein